MTPPWENVSVVSLHPQTLCSCPSKIHQVTDTGVWKILYLTDVDLVYKMNSQTIKNKRNQHLRCVIPPLCPPQEPI